ncbi:MAG TPA: class I SAM-dependent methyltransferase [Oculatellaceae cyanobacterium]
MSAFDLLYASRLPMSRNLRMCRLIAFGTHDPDLFLYSPATGQELHLLFKLLKLAPNDVLADFGCGLGGAGLYVANCAKARLFGVDGSLVAATMAQQLGRNMMSTVPSIFVQGDIMGRIPQFPACCIDGAMSVDVAMLLPDCPAFFREVARCLKPGKMFAFTTYVMPTTIQDYRPILEDAGFRVELYVQPEGWSQRQLLFYQTILFNQHALLNECPSHAPALIEEAATQSAMIANQLLQRLVISARKR